MILRASQHFLPFGRLGQKAGNSDGTRHRTKNDKKFRSCSAAVLPGMNSTQRCARSFARPDIRFRTPSLVRAISGANAATGQLSTLSTHPDVASEKAVASHRNNFLALDR